MYVMQITGTGQRKRAPATLGGSYRSRTTVAATAASANKGGQTQMRESSEWERATANKGRHEWGWASVNDGRQARMKVGGQWQWWQLGSSCCCTENQETGESKDGEQHLCSNYSNRSPPLPIPPLLLLLLFYLVLSLSSCLTSSICIF